jgi:hypothetical protein
VSGDESMEVARFRSLSGDLCAVEILSVEWTAYLCLRGLQCPAQRPEAAAANILRVVRSHRVNGSSKLFMSFEMTVFAALT